MNGQIIGINSAMYSSSSASGASASGGGSVGLGFAIPINTVKDVLGDMRSGGGEQLSVSMPDRPHGPLPPCTPAGVRPERRVRTAEVGTAADAKLEHMVTTKVLIVDDEPAVREALQRSLAFEGYETEVAVDGAGRAGEGRRRTSPT